MFAYDLSNRLRSETNPLGITTSYEYDAGGSRRFKTDGDGLRTEYQYDENRRLTKVLFADGTAYEYDYDARGNRTLERMSMSALSEGPVSKHSDGVPVPVPARRRQPAK